MAESTGVNDNGWREHGRLVLAELERNHADHEEIIKLQKEHTKRITALEIKVATMGVKVAAFCAGIGIVAAAIASAVMGRLG